jgi:hypothetical protein
MNSSWADEWQEKPKMKALRYGVFAVAVAIAAIAQSQTAKAGAQPSARERLIGAWHLSRIDSPGPDGKSADVPPPVGMLIYTRDGHMSVQLMYPKSANGISNEYVLNGYEASFGSYDVDEATHTVTHHVQGSNTGGLLVGKDLPRIFQFTEDGRRLIIRSARSDEHWSVTWEHY